MRAGTWSATRCTTTRCCGPSAGVTKTTGMEEARRRDLLEHDELEQLEEDEEAESEVEADSDMDGAGDSEPESE